MDRLRRYEIFTKAAEAGSFARAATLMRLDPSAVSHAVGQLERDLGVTLFYRTTRQLRLTAEGESLATRAKELLQGVSELENAVRAQKTLSGVLRIGLHVPINRNIVMPRVGEFMRRHPALRIECLVLSQIKDMHASGVDVLVSATTPSGSDLVARKLATLRFGVYAAPSYLAAAGEPRKPEDLAHHACLVHRPPYLNKPLDEWEFVRGATRAVVKVRRGMVSDDREGLVEAALAGAGIMRIGMFDPALITSGRLRRLLTDWDCVGAPSMHAFYRRASRSVPKVAAFLRFLEDAFKAFDPEELTVTHPK
ncbi:MAG TPA: LysR substrate-binding domain-containing protein [Burkholderiales bacterium]|nr:LysR substrate-binding domain-containing protein [Burkholderiales bacterium]